MWPYLQWNASEDHAIYHVGNKVLLSIRYHLDSLSRRTRPDEGHPGDRHFHLQRRHSRRLLFHCFAIAFSEPPGGTCHVLLSSQLLIFTPPKPASAEKSLSSRGRRWMMHPDGLSRKPTACWSTRWRSLSGADRATTAPFISAATSMPYN